METVAKDYSEILWESLKWTEKFDGRCPLDRLAATLFVSDTRPESRLMVMFSAYFDASGDHKKPFIVVSGYIANFVQWKALERIWRELHEEYGLSLPFHASEFFAAFTTEWYKTQTNARKDYIEIAKTPARAKEFFAKLCNAQLSLVHCGVSCIVPMQIYDEINALLELQELVPPYALGARMCVDWIKIWEKEMDIQYPTEIIFERGDFGQGKFTELMQVEGMETPIYKDKKDFAGLQAADHYAWEQNYRLKEEQRNEVLPLMREELQSLLLTIPKRHLVVPAESLVLLCQKKNISIRVKK